MGTKHDNPSSICFYRPNFGCSIQEPAVIDSPDAVSSAIINRGNENLPHAFELSGSENQAKWKYRTPSLVGSGASDIVYPDERKPDVSAFRRIVDTNDGLGIGNGSAVKHDVSALLQQSVDTNDGGDIESRDIDMPDVSAIKQSVDTNDGEEIGNMDCGIHGVSVLDQASIQMAAKLLEIWIAVCPTYPLLNKASIRMTARILRIWIAVRLTYPFLN